MANDGGTCHNEIKLSSNYQASRPIVKHHEGAECRLFRWETTWKERKVLNLHKNNEQLACIKQQEEWNDVERNEHIEIDLHGNIL